MALKFCPADYFSLMVLGRVASVVLAQGSLLHAIGSAVGILPGSGSILGSFAAYSLVKKVSQHSAQFGKGAIEGVAAPESANNALAFIHGLSLLRRSSFGYEGRAAVVFCEGG
jgi:TctA family transporter